MPFCRPGWPQADRDPPVSTSRVLRLKAWVTTARHIIDLFKEYFYIFFDKSKPVYNAS